jgi:hypothetical protein
MTLQPGDRVQITGVMPDDPDPLPVGTTGTVVRLFDSGTQADVDWDNGRTLLLLVDVDPYRVIATRPEPTCEGMASNGQEEDS